MAVYCMNHVQHDIAVWARWKGLQCTSKPLHQEQSNEPDLFNSRCDNHPTHPHHLADSKESLKTLNEGTAVKNSYKMSAQAACSGTMAANYNSPLFNCQPLYKLLFVYYGTKQCISVEPATEYGTNWVQTELRFYCPLCFLIRLSFHSSCKLLKRELRSYFYLNVQSVPRSKHFPFLLYKQFSQCCIGK